MPSSRRASTAPGRSAIATFEDPTPRQYNIFHDKRGNLLDDGRQVFEYDALNRLTGVWQSARGGQPSGPGSEFEPGTKGHPIAAFTYDGYGHRLTARYNVNNNTVIDDDPVDVYAYDRLWRVRTVTRATPSGSSAEATWMWYVREKWYYHDTESGQEMMTGPASTDAPIMRLIDRNGNGSFADPGEEQHFVNDHQGSTVLVTGKATLDSEGELVSRGPIIAHVKYDQYGVPKFVHPADVNSDGVVDAADDTFWKAAWNEYVNGAANQTPPKEIWKGVADANDNETVDETPDGAEMSIRTQRARHQPECALPGSATTGKCGHKVEVVKEVNHGVGVEIRFGPVAAERGDKVQIVKEIQRAVRVEIGCTRARGDEYLHFIHSRLND